MRFLIGSARPPSSKIAPLPNRNLNITAKDSLSSSHAFTPRRRYPKHYRNNGICSWWQVCPSPWPYSRRLGKLPTVRWRNWLREDNVERWKLMSDLVRAKRLPGLQEPLCSSVRFLEDFVIGRGGIGGAGAAAAAGRMRRKAGNGEPPEKRRILDIVCRAGYTEGAA